MVTSSRGIDVLAGGMIVFTLGIVWPSRWLLFIGAVICVGGILIVLFAKPRIPPTPKGK